MNRPYNKEFFQKRVNYFRKKIPQIALTTDVIVGFPGETEEYFEETKKFIEEINFSRLHVFSFSAHEKTPAFKMNDQVDRQIIKKRSRILNDLNKKLMFEYRKMFIGKKLLLVVEGKKGRGLLTGKSEYYFDVEFNSSQLDKNISQKDIIEVVMKK